MLLDISHVSVTLRDHNSPGTDHCALRDVSLRLEVGQHTALLGPNGAGKSTLLRLMRGELWPDAGSGSIRWYPEPHAISAAPSLEEGDDSPLTGRALSALVSAAQHESYVRQAWDLRGEDLLLTGLEDSPLLYSLPPPKQQARVRELAHSLHLDALLQRKITSLSQGQLRLLLLARALVRRPPLLLLDECLDGLDANSRQNMLRILTAQAASSTFVISSHRAHSLPPWIRRTLYVQDGQVYETPPPAYETPASAYETPAPVYETPPPASVYETPPPATESPAFAPQSLPLVPESIAEAAPFAPPHIPQGAAPLVDICNATVFVEGVALLHRINWRILPGEHWLLRGENGSGKSTLLRLLAGDEYPAAGGSISRRLPRCLGHEDTVSELEYIRQGVRLVSDLQQAVYEYELSAEELVLSGFDGSVGVYREFSREEHCEAAFWLQRVGMHAFARRSFRTLSTGQTRRLFLARALVGRPDLLLLDEPCSGLDAASRSHILQLIDSLAAEGIHTVLVSHHGEDRLAACNREAVMEQGALRIVR